MGLSSRLQRRLDRRVPQGVPELRALTVRLYEREAPPPTPRVLVGSNLRLGEEKKVKALRVAKVEPNAPLLMRLVRNPYALPVVRPQRRPSREPRLRTGLGERRESLRASVRELRALVRGGNPMRALCDHRPTAPPHPFSRVREEGQ